MMLGNGVVGILSETINKWERRVPLTPSHCAQLLQDGSVERIIVQGSTKRIHHDELYKDAGCKISDDLYECGLILGIKQPRVETILPDRGYAFFSHTHKAQQENMPLLDRILVKRATLFDYELITGGRGERLFAFGFAGIAGMIDFLHGLGQRYLSLGYSTPFLSLGLSYMYPSLDAAKAAVRSVGEEIASMGVLTPGISPLVFVFTGDGNVSKGAREIIELLPHSFVNSSKLPELYETARYQAQRRVFQVYGCVVTCQDMVEHRDLPASPFVKADYYAHPESYRPIFHENIAPYTSVLVNCMYWERKYPRLLTTEQVQHLVENGCPLVGIADISCDVGGSIEFVNQTTSIDSPFFGYDPRDNSYHHDMEEANGIICSAVDILPTEFAREASQHFSDILFEYVGSLSSSRTLEELPEHLQRACIAHGGSLTSSFDYISELRNSDLEQALCLL